MARKKPVDARVQAFVAAVLSERPHNEEEDINDIELAMEELADAVAAEFATQLLARHTAENSAQETGAPACPHCGGAGRLIGERRREILTTRSSAPLIEPKCYCAACRRNFFPSVAAFGIGDGV